LVSARGSVLPSAEDRTLLEAGVPDEEATDVLNDLISVFCGAMRAERYAEILAALATGGPGDAETRLSVCYHYCSLLRDTEWSFRVRVLERCHLPAEDGRWRPAASLTAAGNVAPAFRAVPRVLTALGLHVTDASTEVVGSAEDSDGLLTRFHGSRDVLEDYFTPFISAQVPHEALGILVALLGRGAEGQVEALAEEWLGAFQTIDNLREEIWLGRERDDYRAHETSKTLFGNAQIVVEVRPDGHLVRVRSILGTEMEAEVGGVDTPTSLVVTAPHAGHEDQGAPSVRLLELRRIDPMHLEPASLLQAVRGTIEDVFQGLTGFRPGSGFDRLWARIQEPGQVQVEVVRRVIRAELSAQLRLLGFKSPEPEARRLADCVRRVEQARQALIELKLAIERAKDGEGDRAHRLKGLQEKLDVAAENLEELIEGDPKVQEFLLRRVRRHLRQSQYDVERILLELFQNADDAVAQLQEQATERHGVA